ncbi:TPA: DUF1640 domain-containing protein [Escherichia coli]|nr:DUF1640 domain-containing protein [Escherichia coli]HEL8385947.1 DUF1640 domain-containing protein [Escherichia coli]
MAQVFFDTLKFVEKLEAAGVPAAQARAISDAVRDSHETMELATKRDLEDLKKDLTIKIGGMFVVAVGVLAAIIKFPI